MDKFDDFTRLAITFRLSQFFQDFLPELDDLVIFCYALLIARYLLSPPLPDLTLLMLLLIRLSTMSTKLADSDLLYKSLQSGVALSFVTPNRSRKIKERQSDLSLDMNRLDLQESAATIFNATTADDCLPEKVNPLVECFFAEEIKRLRRRYTLKEDLALLWADSLTIIRAHFPVLEEHVRFALLSRSRYHGYARAILALGNHF